MNFKCREVISIILYTIAAGLAIWGLTDFAELDKQQKEKQATEMVQDRS